MPEIAARAHVDLLDGIVAQRDEGGRCRLRAIVGGRGRRRSRPDRRRDRRPDHREGDRDGARHAADRGQSSRSPRADAAADLRAGVSLLPVPRLRRPYPDRRRASASANMCGSAPPSTTRWARPSTRSRRCSALPYPGGPEVERAAASGDREAVRVSAADARAAGCEFLAVGTEDRRAQRSQPHDAAGAAGHQRSLRRAFRPRCWNRPRTG